MVDFEAVEINEIDSFISFLSSIEWHDPWILALFAFHLTITMMALLTRSYVLLVYFSESINEIAASNWQVFSRQQYFDSKGLFISVVFSMPILLNCMLMVGSWLYQSTQLMKNLKRAQLKEELKKEMMNTKKGKLE